MNASSIVENATQIKIRIAINVDMSVRNRKNVFCAKNILFGILLHVILKMINM